DDEDRRRETKQYETIATVLEYNLGRLEPKLDKVNKELKDLKIDDLEEKKRIADVRVKLNRVLADADMLILPRVTFVDIPDGIYIDNEIHGLNESQFEAVRDFLKAGKPILFCLGPSNSAGEFPRGAGTDLVEKSLEELGFKLPKQTILFTSEVEAYAQ